MEIRDTAPAEGEAVIRVGSVGICGTDIGIASGVISVAYPRILGHEVVGELVDPGTTDLPPGTAVLIDPGLTCGSCTQCREGRSNICTRGGLLGRDADGGLRDLMSTPSSNVHALPASIDRAIAPLVQVLATCEHAQRLVAPAPGERVAVIGLGVTGLLHVQLAAMRGASVIGITRSAAKLALADSLGADLVVAADGNEVEAVRTAAGDVDLVIECAGTSATLARAIELARVGGRILSYGTIGRRDTEGLLHLYELYYKELSIVGARSARPEDFVAAIDMVGTGRIELEPLVSARFSILEVSEAFEAAARSETQKVLIDV